MDTPTPATIPTSPTPTSRPVSSRSGRRRRVLTLISLVALLFVLGITGWFAWRKRDFSHHLSNARIATLEGRTGAALAELRRCGDADPDDPDVLLLEARTSRMLGDWRRAEEALERRWNLRGEDEDLTFERLLLKASRDETDQVAGILRARMAGNPEKIRLCRHAIATGLMGQFRHVEMQDRLDEWLRDTPGDPLALALQGKLNEQLFKYSDAIEAYSTLVRLIPNHHEGRLRLAMMLMQQRQADEALPHLRLLGENLPDNADVTVQWALALRQVGRTDESVAALDVALERFPNAPDALAERGSIALNNGDDELADRLLSRAIRINPGMVSARSLRAQAFTRLGRTEEAAAENRTIKTLTDDADRLTILINGPLQTRPNDPAPPFEIAGIALRSGHPNEAIQWFEMALKRNPHHAPSHTALAVIHQEMGNPVLATRHRALAARAEGKQ